jgi:hypothetical protein
LRRDKQLDRGLRAFIKALAALVDPNVSLRSR